MSTAIQKRSRGVSVNRPSRSSAAAKATEWTSTSNPSGQSASTSAKTRSTSSSERTSQEVTSGEPTDAASSRTLLSIRSPWNVNASSAPSSASRFPIAHAIERLFATPRISARLPSNRFTPASLRSIEPRDSDSRGRWLLSGRAPPPGTRCTLRGAPDRDVRCCRAEADRAPRRRVRGAARPRRHDHRAARAPQGPPDGDRHAGAAPARRPLPQLHGPQRLAPPRHLQQQLPRLRHAASRRSGQGRGDPEAGDPIGPGDAELHAAPERDGGGAPGEEAGDRRQAPLRAQGVPEPALHARDEPQPRPDPRRRARRGRRRRRRGHEDRDRRRRRRSGEPVLRARRLRVPPGLPEGRREVDDAEGDRRTVLRRCRRGRPEPAGTRPAGVVPRHARRRDRGRERGHDRTGGRRSSGHDRAGRRRAARADRQLPRLQRAHRSRPRRQHTRDRRRVRSGGRRRHGRDQLLGRRPTDRPAERRARGGGAQRLGGRCGAGDLRRERPRRVRARLRRLPRHGAGCDLGGGPVQLARVRAGATPRGRRRPGRTDPGALRGRGRNACTRGLGQQRPGAGGRRHGRRRRRHPRLAQALRPARRTPRADAHRFRPARSRARSRSSRAATARSRSRRRA